MQNKDETGISIVYTPPWIVISKDIKAQAITITKSSFTIIDLLEMLLEITCICFMCLRGNDGHLIFLQDLSWADGTMKETKVFENNSTKFNAKHTGITQTCNRKAISLFWYYIMDKFLSVTSHPPSYTQYNVSIFDLLKSISIKSVKWFYKNILDQSYKNVVAELAVKPYLH